MLWLRALALTLSVGAAWWLGIELAAHALRAPSRLGRAALGAGIAVVALGLPLLWLPRVLPAGAALVTIVTRCPRAHSPRASSSV